MRVDLNGLRAVVTGSTAGIGFTIAERLAANGAEVGINGRTRERVDMALERLAEHNPTGAFFSLPGDIATAEGSEAVLHAAGAVDLLINNAAWFQPKDVFEISDAEWSRAFDVNVLGAIRLTRALGPRMREKGFGRIVFISSESAIQIPTEMVHYGMTKTALLALTRGFAQALQQSGVTVNAILPGPTRSEGVEVFIRDLASQQNRSEEEMEREFFRHARPTSLLKRFITPEEIADAVLFVCSREAAAITGSPIRVDGGVVLSVT